MRKETSFYDISYPFSTPGHSLATCNWCSGPCSWQLMQRFMAGFGEPDGNPEPLYEPDLPRCFTELTEQVPVRLYDLTPLIDVSWAEFSQSCRGFFL